MNLIREMARAAYNEWISGVEALEPRFEDLPPDHIDRLERSQVKALARAADIHPLIRAACQDLIA